MALIARHSMGARPAGVNSILLFFFVLLKRNMSIATFRLLLLSIVNFFFINMMKGKICMYVD